MSVETRKVLDMVAEGKITTEDAEKLLAKLEASSGAEQATPETAPPAEKSGFRRVRFLRIEVDEPGRKQVNIRMPLAFAFAGRSLLGVLPVNVTEKLKVSAPPHFTHSAAADQLVQAIPPRQHRSGFHRCIRLPVAGQYGMANRFLRRAAA